MEMSGIGIDKMELNPCLRQTKTIFHLEEKDMRLSHYDKLYILSSV